MGYTIELLGEFKLDRPLTRQHKAYLSKFSETRRTKRDARKTANCSDPVREAVRLPVGPDGAYFVGGDGLVPQDQMHESEGKGRREPTDIVDVNGPPSGQPTLWCGWVPNDDGTAVVWDGDEKFYMYVEWLEYLIGHFLAAWGYVLNGETAWFGEGLEDFGTIVVTDNEVVVDECGQPPVD